MGSQRDLLCRSHRSAHSARLAAVRARKEFKNFRLAPINSVEGMGGLQLDGGGIDFSNSYFRSADLRGVDFSTSRLEGVSLNRAKNDVDSFSSGNSACHPAR